MALRFEPDVTHAAWFAARAESWVQLSCLGPSGFEGYARLFHPLRPGGVETDPQDLVNVEGDLEASHCTAWSRSGPPVRDGSSRLMPVWHGHSAADLALVTK